VATDSGESLYVLDTQGTATLEYALLLVVLAVPVALAVIAGGLPLLRLYHFTTTVIGLPIF
jgi:Flp pilus assembly pilin Flp